MQSSISLKWIFATAVAALLVLLGIWIGGAFGSAAFFLAIAGGLRLAKRIRADALLDRVFVILGEDRVAFDFDPALGRLYIRDGDVSVDAAYAVVDAFRIARIEASNRFSPEVEACLSNDYEWTERDNISVWTRTRFHW